MISINDVFERMRIYVGVKALNKSYNEFGIPLPMIGSTEGEYSMMNSGGRNFIFQNNGSTYRLKGADPFGDMTTAVAETPNNFIFDVKGAWGDVINKKTYRFFNNKYVLDKYQDRDPFGVLSRESADRGFVANKKISDHYLRNDFNAPCSPIRIFDLEDVDSKADGIYYQDGTELKIAKSILFEIPSPQSDIRLLEFLQSLRAGFNYAEFDDVIEYSDEVNELFINFSNWNGFITRVLHDNYLFPSKNSFHDQNYVITEVSDGKYGLSRVDHTSTVFNPNAHKDEFTFVFNKNQENSSFQHIPRSIMLGKFLRDRGEILDEQSFNSFFDRGYYYQMNEIYLSIPAVPVKNIKKMAEFIDESDIAFKKGYNGDVLPIDENRFTRFPLLFGEEAQSALKSPLNRKISLDFKDIEKSLSSSNSPNFINRYRQWL